MNLSLRSRFFKVCGRGCILGLGEYSPYDGGHTKTLKNTNKTLENKKNYPAD
jgi:hypothetical protein